MRQNSAGRLAGSTTGIAIVLLTVFSQWVLAPGSATGQVDQATLQAAQARAVQQILVSARSEVGYLRANVFESAEALPMRIGPLVQRGLNDPEAVVRFAALATIGKMKLAGVAPNARSLLQDPNESVRAAAIFALAMNFGTNPAQNAMAVDVSPMAPLLFSGDAGTRANVAMLMGMMGDKSAAPLLREAARADLPMTSPVKATLTRLQIGEALVKLGDFGALDAIRASAYSQFDEVRVLSVQTLGRLRDQAWQPAIKNMLGRPPIELQIAAAGALGQMGDASGLDLLVQSTVHQLDTVRAQSAIALGMIRSHPRAIQELLRLLDDRSEMVRLSAATGLLGGGRDGL